VLAQLKRRTVATALGAAFLALLALPGVASAKEKDSSLIRKGVYEGVWHTDPVTIIVEKVNPDGTFTGEIHFDPNGRWGDVRAGFTAWLGADDSLTMTRTDCPQTTRTGRPERRGGSLVWTGEVRGPDFAAPFELCIPLERR
jgi:hypothetical protein